MNRKYKDLLTDTFIFGIGTIGSRLILFLLVPLYTALLTTEEYGIADLVITVGQMLIPLTSLALPDSIIPYGMAKGIQKENVLMSSMVMFLLCSIISLLFIPLLDLYEAIGEWKWHIYLYLIISFFNLIVFNYLKVCNKNKTYSFLSILNAFLLVVFNVIFLQIMSMGIKGYILSTILSLLICSTAAFFFGNMRNELQHSQFDRKLTKEMIIYSLPLIANAVSWWLVQNSNKVLLQVLGSSAILGLYTAASKIPSLLNMINTIFNQAWGLSAIKTYNESDNNKEYYSKVFRFFIIILFLVCIVLIGIIKPFMSIYVGDDFFEAWTLVPALLLSACFAAISSFCGAFYGTVRKSRAIMTTTVFASIVNIISNLILIPLISVYGAVISTVLAYAVVAFLRMIDSRKISNIDYSTRLLSILVLLVIIQVVLVSLNYYIFLSSICVFITAIYVCRKDLVILFLYTVKKKR